MVRGKSFCIQCVILTVSACVGFLSFTLPDRFRAILKGIYIEQLLLAYFVTVPHVEVISTLSSARMNSLLQDIYSRSDSRQGKVKLDYLCTKAKDDEIMMFQITH